MTDPRRLSHETLLLGFDVSSLKLQYLKKKRKERKRKFQIQIFFCSSSLLFVDGGSDVQICNVVPFFAAKRSEELVAAVWRRDQCSSLLSSHL